MELPNHIASLDLKEDILTVLFPNKQDFYGISYDYFLHTILEYKKPDKEIPSNDKDALLEESERLGDFIAEHDGWYEALDQLCIEANTLLIYQDKTDDRGNNAITYIYEIDKDMLVNQNICGKLLK